MGKNKDVLQITFDASKSIKALESELLSSMGKISSEATEKLNRAFDNAGRNNSTKTQFTGIYQNLFDQLSLSNGDIEEINSIIDEFAGKITFLNQMVKQSNMPSLFSGLSITKMNKILGYYDQIVEKNEELSKINSNSFRSNKINETKVDSLKSIEDMYAVNENDKKTYSDKISKYFQKQGIGSSLLSSQIEEYAHLISLYQNVLSEKFEKGSDEAIVQAQQLLFIFKQIQGLESKKDIGSFFADFRNKTDNIESMKDLKGSNRESILNGRLGQSITSLSSLLKKQLQEDIQKIKEAALEKAIENYEKTEDTSVRKTKEKIEEYKKNKNAGSGDSEENNSGNNSTPDKISSDVNKVDTWKKSAEALKDEFKDVIQYANNVEDTVSRLKELWNQYNKKGGLDKYQLKEMLALSKRAEILKSEGFIDKHPLSKDALDEISSLNDIHPEYNDFFEKIVKLTEAQLLKNKELQNSFTGNGSAGIKVGVSPDIDPEEFVKETEEKLRESGRKVKVDVEPNVDPESFVNDVEVKLRDTKVAIELNPVINNIDLKDIFENGNAKDKHGSLEQMLVSWMEAHSLMKKGRSLDSEKIAVSNSKTGFVSNANVTGGKDGVSAKLINAIVENAEQEIDTLIHSHPESISAFSPTDIQSAILEYASGITNWILASMENIAVLDVSKIKDLNPFSVKSDFEEEIERLKISCSENLKTISNFQRVLASFDSEDADINPIATIWDFILEQVEQNISDGELSQTLVKYREEVLSDLTLTDSTDHFKTSDDLGKQLYDLSVQKYVKQYMLNCRGNITQTELDSILKDSSNEFSKSFSILYEKIFSNPELFLDAIMSDKDYQLLVKEALSNILRNNNLNYDDVIKTIPLEQLKNSSIFENDDSKKSNSVGFVEKIKNELLKTGSKIGIDVTPVVNPDTFVQDIESQLNERDVKIKVSPIQLEADFMQKIATHASEAADAKEKFVEANKHVKQSIDDSENPLQLEAEFMELVSIYAKEAANAKQEFVQANADVVESIDNSENPLQLEAAFMEELATQARAAADAMQDYFDAEEKVKSKKKPEAPQKKEPKQNNGGQKSSDNSSDVKDLEKERYLKESEKWKILSQTGMATDDSYSATYEKNKGQIELVKFSARRDEEGNYIYDDRGNIDYEISSTIISDYKKLEKEIINADNSLRKLIDDKRQILALDSEAETPWLDKQIKDQGQYIKLLNDTIQLIEQAQSEVETSDGSTFNKDYLIDTNAIREARKKAKDEYNTTKGVRQEKSSAKQNANNKKKKETNAIQVQRILSRRQIDADRIERKYSLDKNDSLTKYIDENTQDFKDLSQIKAQIDGLISKLTGQTRNKSNEKDFLELDKLIEKYKDLADAKLKANNPTKQELGGEKLDIAISEMIADYDKLISKAEQYGDEASAIVKALTEQRDILTSVDENSGQRTATNKEYEKARDVYKTQSSALTTLQTKEVNKQTSTFDELNSKISEYEKIKKRIASGKALQGDVETAEQLEKEILELENLPILSPTQIEKTEQRLLSLYTVLQDIEKQAKQTEVFDQLNSYVDEYSKLRWDIQNGKGTPDKQLRADALESKILELENNSVLSKNQINEVENKLIKLFSDLQNDSEKKEENKIITELNSKISEYENVAKRIASGKALQGDVETLNSLDEYISKQLSSLSDGQIEKIVSKLNNAFSSIEHTTDKKKSKDDSTIWNENLETIKKYLAARTELNKLEAKNVGKDDTDNIKRQRKEVEKLKEEAEKARKTLSDLFSPYKRGEDPSDDWKEMMKIFRQASVGSDESVSKLNDARKDFNNSELKKIDKQLLSYQNKYDKLLSSRTSENRSGDFTKLVEKYHDAINRLEAEKERLSGIFKNSSENIISDADLENVKSLLDELKNIELEKKTTSFGSKEVSRKKERDIIEKYLKDNPKLSKKAKLELQGYIEQLDNLGADVDVDKIHSAFLDVIRAERDAKNEGKGFLDVFKEKVWYQWAAQIGTLFSFGTISQKIKEGIQVVRELDTALVEIRKVTNETENSYKNFAKTISKTAKEIASTNVELLNSSADYLRLGHSLAEAENLAKNTALFVNVGDGVDINEATEDIITAMKAFDIKTEDSIKIVDSYNQIGNKFALSASDIGDAMKRSASALETANNSFDESIALITAMNEVTQDAETTGTTLKVMSLRVRGAKADLEAMSEDTDGLADSTSKMREEIKALTGVDIMIDDNTFKSTAQQIKELGAVWDDLSDTSQAATLELIAGKSRANAVQALLKNYKQINKVIEELENSEGSALKENEAIVDSINGRIKILSASAEEFWSTFIDTDLVKNVVSSLTTLLDLLTKIVDTTGALPTLLTMIGGVLGARGHGLTNYVT